MTGTIEDQRSVYPRLLAISRQAFAHAHYEVAYHALAAALHSACDDGDQERVSDIRTIATRQGAWIDTHRPEHRLSSSSAEARGQRSMFGMLARQAEAAGHIRFPHRPTR